MFKSRFAIHFLNSSVCLSHHPFSCPLLIKLELHLCDSLSRAAIGRSISDSPPLYLENGYNDFCLAFQVQGTRCVKAHGHDTP